MTRVALAAVLLACLAGSAVSRPATRAAIPAEPDPRAWRTWPALPPASAAPAVVTVPVATAGLRVQPDPVPVAVQKAPRPPRTARSGKATWFAAPAGTAAAGPALRAFLGKGWRGDRVRVCGPVGCRTLALTDWMRADKLIDLPAVEFPRICGRLSIGVCRVTVARA